MTALAVSSTGSVLAVIGLVVGLVVLLVVIWLLSQVLAPLRKALADVKDAETAPMLTRGVPGTEQLGQTRRLAESVPDLALAYLSRLNLPARPAPPTLSASAPPAAPPQPQARPVQTQLDAPSNLPAWKLYNQ